MFDRLAFSNLGVLTQMVLIRKFQLANENCRTRSAEKLSSCWLQRAKLENLEGAEFDQSVPVLNSNHPPSTSILLCHYLSSIYHFHSICGPGTERGERGYWGIEHITVQNIQRGSQKEIEGQLSASDCISREKGKANLRMLLLNSPQLSLALPLWTSSLDSSCFCIWPSLWSCVTPVRLVSQLI